MTIKVAQIKLNRNEDEEGSIEDVLNDGVEVEDDYGELHVVQSPIGADSIIAITVAPGDQSRPQRLVVVYRA